MHMRNRSASRFVAFQATLVLAGIAFMSIVVSAKEKCVCPTGVSQGTTGTSTQPTNQGYNCSVTSTGTISITLGAPTNGSGQGSSGSGGGVVCFLQITTGAPYTPYKSTTDCAGVQDTGQVTWTTTQYRDPNSGAACKLHSHFLGSPTIDCDPPFGTPTTQNYDNYQACPGCQMQ